MRKKLLRLLRSAPLALLFAAGVASAQTTGTIIGVVTDASTGKPVTGALVIATSPNLQGEQTAVSDQAGNFRLQLLPPGQYQLAVQLEGYKPAERSDIVVRVDKTIRANLAVVPEAVQMEEQVVRTGLAPVVNVGTAETGMSVSKEFVSDVPLGRNFEAVAVTVPSARKDDYGVGFAGAQSPENAYILDGLNINDVSSGNLTGQGRNGTTTPLLSNFVEELDVKTGGYMPEYGRSSGGIVTAVTKSGSNEFHGSVWANFDPLMLSPTGKASYSIGTAPVMQDTPGQGAYNLDLGFEVGGPILKDRLWFYAGFAPVTNRIYTDRYLQQSTAAPVTGGVCQGLPIPGNSNYAGACLATDSKGLALSNKIAGTDEYVTSGATTYQYTGKLTFLINENNNVSLSVFGLPSSSTILQPNPSVADSIRTYKGEENTNDIIARYAGKFLEKKLIVEVVGGYHYQTGTPIDQTLAGVDQFNTPSIRWKGYNPLSAFEASKIPAGACAGESVCLVNNYFTGGRLYTEDTKGTRLNGRVSASYLWEGLGSHISKAGIDLDHATFDITKFYGGGYSYDYRSDRATPRFQVVRGYGNLPADVTSTADLPNFSKLSTASQTNSNGYYLQDSWQVIPPVTVNLGLRWETQSLNAPDGPVQPNGISIGNMWAPRVQAIWDFTGQGRGKLAASYGRFYFSMPLDAGDRAFYGETSPVFSYVPATSCPGFTGPGSYFDPKSLSPATTGCTLATAGALAPSTIGGITPVDPNLTGAYVDQFAATVEYEILSDLSLGFEYNGRRQTHIIEDMSFDDGNHYFISNPGQNAPYTYTYQGETTPTTVSSKTFTSTDPATGRTVTGNFPVPERSYDGFTFRLTKNFSKNWLAQASYTYSYLRGNYSGPYRPETGQLDPGISSEYDLATLMTNRNGYLPGDQPHFVKLYGAYTWNLNPKMNVVGGIAYRGASGTPVSALGAHPVYGNGESFVLPRGIAGRTPWVNAVDLSGQFEYVINAPYAIRFTAQVFNVLNQQEALMYDQNYTFDTVLPIVNANCTSKDAAGQNNPAAALQSACPDLAYLRTVDGRNVTVNPNWGRPRSTAYTVNTIGPTWQAPIALRFGLALTF